METKYDFKFFHKNAVIYLENLYIAQGYKYDFSEGSVPEEKCPLNKF